MYKFALLTATVSFLLIVAGGLVTSTDSGLAVPDWPLSYGTWMPPMVGGILFEHSHRMIAATVGLLTLILTLWILFKESRRQVRWLGIFALGLVVFQGILGGITVLHGLPALVSIGHATLAQTFFATIVVLATVLSPGWKLDAGSRRLEVPSPQLRLSALLTTVAIYLQLILGATLRHVGWLPHLVAMHILGAVVVLVLVVRTSGTFLKRYRQEPTLARPAQLMIWLLLGQWVLGFLTLIRGADVGIATAHVAVGALLLATCARLTLLTWKSSTNHLSPVTRHLSPPTSPPSTHSPIHSFTVFLELTKPRLTALAVSTAGLGFLLGTNNAFLFGKFLMTLLGTICIGAGASVLNQVLEKEADSRMDRTKQRPLPSGRVGLESALTFGVVLSVAGLLILSLGTNLLAGSLAALTLASYLFLYTPLKSRSALCTLVGAIPGALPPMIGWAAATGSLGKEAWLLFAILFLWQLPHFLALAWKFRDDYAQAGFKMLPVLDPDGGLTFRQSTLYCLALVPVTLLPAAWGWAGGFYFLAALVSSLAFLGLGVKAARVRTRKAAHQFFLASVLYLPFLLTTLMIDRIAL